MKTSIKKCLLSKLHSQPIISPLLLIYFLFEMAFLFSIGLKTLNLKKLLIIVIIFKNKIVNKKMNGSKLQALYSFVQICLNSNRNVVATVLKASILFIFLVHISNVAIKLIIFYLYKNEMLHMKSIDFI